VREVLLTHPELRERYGEVKARLALEPEMDIGRYIEGKSAVIQDILAVSGLAAAEKRRIYQLNTGRA
jgi:GrpB-like predicted nucleotidyltransferase (UPF0157 family)